MEKLEKKIPPPVVFILFSLLMWWLSGLAEGLFFDMPPGLNMALVLVLMVMGFSLPLAGLVSFKRAKTTMSPVAPEQASRLVTTGIYSYTRNPMYLGLSSLLLAWGLSLSSFLALLCVAFFVLYIFRFQIVPEEKALLENFGDQFLNYKIRVRRWL